MEKCEYCGRYYTGGYGGGYCSKRCWEADGSPEFASSFEPFINDSPVFIVLGTLGFIIGWFIFVYFFHDSNSLVRFVNESSFKVGILILAGVSLVQRLLMRNKGCLLRAIIMLLPPVLIVVLGRYNII